MNQPVRPDRVTGPADRGRQLVMPFVREAVLLLPNMVKLITRLIRDERVPTTTKLFAGGMVVYLISPIDLLPEALLGPLGAVDDLILAAYTLDRLMKVAGPSVVAEHWDGSREVGELVATILDVTSHLVPKPIRQLLQRLGG